MSETTNLKLFKHDNPSTNENQFDVQKALNNNWDKIDDFAGNVSNKVDGQANNIETLQDNVAKLQESQIEQDIDIEAIKAENERLRQDLNAFPSGQAEGEYITLKDSADSRFNMFRIGGNSKQETRSGKNLINVIKETLTTNGITFTNNKDGSITINGTATDTAFFAMLEQTFTFKQGQTYSAYLGGTTKGLSMTIRRNSINEQLLILPDGQEAITQNYSGETADDAYAYIRVAAGTTLNNVTVYPMLVEGSEIGEWEPYGAMPSPEYPSEIQNVEGNINVTVCNKNLFTGFIKGKGLNPSTGEETQENNKATSDFIETDFNKNSNYYLSGLTDRLWSFIAAYDKNKKFLSRTTGNPRKEINLNKTSITNKNGEIKFIRITQYENIGAEGTINDIDNLQVQLEVGNTTTDYVQHQEQNFTFPLAEGQKLYKGDYLAEDGIHHKRKQVELDGTENFIAIGKNYYLTIVDKKIRYEQTKGKILCTHFKETQGWGEPDIKVNEIFEGYYEKGNKNVFFNYDNGEGGVEGFKSYLAAQKQAGTPVIVEYELEEEEIEPYTPEQQEAYNKILQTAKSYKNVTNIYSPDPVSLINSVNYRKDIETLLTQQNELILEGGN